MPVGIHLKPCPFCGANGSNLIYDTEILNGKPVGFVECLNCPAIIRSGNVGAAVKAWNRRAKSTGICQHYKAGQSCRVGYKHNGKLIKCASDII
jgi:Lar family restriction alleviation protein